MCGEGAKGADPSHACTSSFSPHTVAEGLIRQEEEAAGGGGMDPSDAGADALDKHAQRTMRCAVRSAPSLYLSHTCIHKRKASYSRIKG